MKRDYKSGKHGNIMFFTGVEVEKTPAYGLKTLFVSGVQPCVDIQTYYDNEGCEHIFFGANHSFYVDNPLIWQKWENMILAFLEADKLCSLDIPLDNVEVFNETRLNHYPNFIPQIRVPIPYAKKWNYNTMVKIDDKDFKATNPGVWCHSLHELMDREKFTDWGKYGLDKVLE
tara:strand:+ start:448 stop:966 length:519 start_codon:yes stop_codon:yes gene_type:complete